MIDSNVDRTIEAFHDLAEAGPDEMTDRPDGMCGAVIPSAGLVWFVELWGTSEQLAKHSDQFLEFVRSVEFDGGRPQWSAPESWRLQPRRGPLFTEYLIGPSADPLAVRVAPLQAMPKDHGKALFVNINDWRTRLSLPRIKWEELPDNSVNFFAGDKYAVAVYLTGIYREIEREPRAGSELPAGHPELPAGHPEVGSGGTGNQTPPATASLPFTFEAPDEWTLGRTSSMRKAAFEVVVGEKKVEVIVLDLAARANDFMMNVNFWRGSRLNLPPTTWDEVKSDVEEIDIGGLKGQMIEMTGESRAGRPTTVIGVMAPYRGIPWTFTLKGDPDLAKQERTRFLEFLQSVQFKDTDGADNGN